MSRNENAIADLTDGKVPWLKMKEIISDPGDPELFQQLLGILQSRVSWDEKILLPVGEHLYIVQKDAERVVKCDCGHEFGDYHYNWKHQARIRVRKTEDSLRGICHGVEDSAPELREFYCPGCYAVLEVEVVAPGRPVAFDFEPDLEGFYETVLGRRLD